jgi:hypothetical protein
VGAPDVLRLQGGDEVTPTPHTLAPNDGGRLDSWLSPQPRPYLGPGAVEAAYTHWLLTGRSPLDRPLPPGHGVSVCGEPPGERDPAALEAEAARRWIEDLLTTRGERT